MKPVWDFLWHISPALVTVTIGAFALQRFFVRRANAGALVDAIVAELNDLKADALKYWNLEVKIKEDKEAASLLEQKIKGSIKVLAADSNYLCKKYGGAKKLQEFEKLQMHIADAVTGGSFESQNRKVEAARYIMIVNAVNDMRSALMMIKL
jgi:hypothetical protein